MNSIFTSDMINHLKNETKQEVKMPIQETFLIELINYNYLSRDSYEERIKHITMNSLFLKEDFELFLSLIQQFYLKFENKKEYLAEYCILRKLDDYLKAEMFLIFKNYKKSNLTINNNIILVKDENISQFKNKINLWMKIKMKIIKLLKRI